jgi:hypothetical protein
MKGKSRGGVDRKRVVKRLAEMLDSNATEEQFQAARLMILADAANFLEQAVRRFDEILAASTDGRRPD